MAEIAYADLFVQLIGAIAARRIRTANDVLGAPLGAMVDQIFSQPLDATSNKNSSSEPTRHPSTGYG